MVVGVGLKTGNHLRDPTGGRPAEINSESRDYTFPQLAVNELTNLHKQLASNWKAFPYMQIPAFSNFQQHRSQKLRR